MTLTVDAEKKINLIIKAVKEVGFPIVVASFLIYFGVNRADRLLNSQEKFIEEVGTNYKNQTEVMKALVEMAEKQGANIQLITTAQSELITISHSMSKVLEELAKKNGINNQ